MCLSPGTGWPATFELALAQQYGTQCILCDPGDTNEEIHRLHPKISFEQKYLGIEQNENTITIEDWLARHQLSEANPLCLMMDIEGEEYKLLNSIV